MQAHGGGEDTRGTSDVGSELLLRRENPLFKLAGSQLQDGGRERCHTQDREAASAPLPACHCVLGGRLLLPSGLEAPAEAQVGGGGAAVSRIEAAEPVSS